MVINMDMLIFWQGLGLYDPTPAKVQESLAIFAQAYVDHDSIQITDYSIFKPLKP